MEISHSQIAKLVLGYLKIEKCRSAHREFLNSSIYLREYRNKQEKYIATRILGQSLVDILLDYAQIYTIVQGRLEHSDYFNDRNHSENLVNQLLYLLDNPNKFSSRACTPGAFSRCSTPNKDYSRDRHTTAENLSVIESPSTNATPLKSLPGNNVDETITPKRKGCLPLNRSHRTDPSIRHDNESEKEASDKTDDVENSCDERDKSVMESAVNQFAQTLLDHQELQEKIAQNINTINNSDDIDHAIKAVLEKTEADPLFETLMGDIIGSVRDLQTPDLSSKINLHPAEDVANQNKPPNSSIDRQNDVAVDSIICAGQTKPTERLSVNTNSGDIILYDGSFDNYVKTGGGTLATPAPQIQQQIVSGLLMVNAGGTNQTPNQNYVNTMDPMKCIFVNSTPTINVMQKPQTQYILTEQDIMTMPTVILCDEKPKKAAAKTKAPETRRIKTLLPKTQRKAESTQTLSNYLSLYNCNDSMDEIEIGKSVVKKTKVKNKNVEMKQSATVHVEILPETSDVFSSQIERALDVENVVDGQEGVVEETKIVEEKVENKTPQGKMTTRSSASGSKSHVRALDFKFETPGKEILLKKPNSVAKSNGKKKKTPVKAVSKTAKTLFASPSKKILPKKKCGKTLKSWDSALREIPTKDPVVIKLPSPKRKRRKSVGPKKTELNKTADDAMKIEAAIINASDAKVNEDINSSNEENKEKVGKLTRKQNDDASDDSLNLNDKPKQRKKCNVDNAIKKDVKITKVKEIRILENSDKLILSPSKLNANKRSLVDEAIDRPTEVPNAESLSILHSDLMLSVEKPEKFLTPEMARLQTMDVPNSAKRNIIPMLETPIKSIFPTNPEFFSPINTNDTPYTKVFKQQCEGIDLSAIPTPKFPLTPNFPFTPRIEQSPHSNRPTDYSTSSSYYQPSETDQDKSLELYILEECKNKKSETKIQQGENKPEISVSDLIGKGGSKIDGEIELTVRENPDEAIANKMKSMGTNIIGRKNLNLVQHNSSDTSSGDDSETETSSCDSTSSDSSFIGGSANETVVKKSRDNSLSRYSLRSKASHNSSEEKIEEIKPEDAIKNILSSAKFQPVLNREIELFDYQEKVLKEMDEKRKRTIAKFKGETVPEITLTPVPKKKPPARKRATPKQIKINNPTNVRKLRSNSVKTVCEPIHLSSDNDNIQPLEMVETEMLSSSQSTTATEKADPNRLLTFENVLKGINDTDTDQEADKLVKGLKQWGIHLVHNKSPMKPLKAEYSLKTDESISENEKKSLSKPPQDFDEDSTENVLTNHVPDEPIQFVYDEANPDVITRQFDFKIPRMLKNNIYINDNLVDVCLTVTPYWDLFELPSKICKKEIKILSNVTIANKKCHPLKLLMNEMEEEVTASNLQMAAHSPLDDLYSSDKVNYRKRNNNTKKPIRCKDAKDKNASCKSLSRDKDRVAKIDKTATIDKSKLKNGTDDQPVPSEDNKDESQTEDAESKSTTKRKANNELENVDVKKAKSNMCHKLLQNVNLEAFLEKLHGDEEKRDQSTKE